MHWDRNVHCTEHTAIAIIAGKNDASPFFLVEYPEYPKPTAGMIGIAKHRHVTIKAVSTGSFCAKSSAWVNKSVSLILVLEVKGVVRNQLPYCGSDPVSRKNSYRRMRFVAETSILFSRPF
jgi:hypothetical protein